MLADIFNKPVFTKNTVESSAWGAALIGLEALGIQRGEPSVKNKQTEGTQDTEYYYKPSEENHAVYMKNFQKFERLYHILEGEF
ncbi:ribulokinase [compost metagenome]